MTLPKQSKTIPCTRSNRQRTGFGISRKTSGSDCVVAQASCPAIGEASEPRDVLRFAHRAAGMPRNLHAGCVRYVGARLERSGLPVSLSKRSEEHTSELQSLTK